MNLLPPFSTAGWRVGHWIAGALLATLVIAGTIRMLRPQMDERLYAKYRELPQAIFLPPGDTSLAAACRAFNLKQYTNAKPLMERDTQAKYARQTRFFTAICLLELNQMKAAEQLLLPLSTVADPLAQEALWYLALSHLRRHDRAGCTTYLRRIKPENARSMRGSKLLGKI